MILQLSLFQIFFMALSIVGLSFCILYLFIGGYNYDHHESYDAKAVAKEKQSRRADNVYDIGSARRTRPVPHHRTSVGRQQPPPQRTKTSGMRVLEVDYKVVHERGTFDDITLDAISQITDRIASGTGRW